MKDTFLQDIMLGEYFRLTCLFGSLGGEEKRAFNALADIFVVGERERAALYDLTEHGSAAEISSAADHRRYCRVREYLSLMGEDADVSEDDAKCAALKGAAYIALEEEKLLDSDSVQLKSAAKDKLVQAASGGAVRAMRSWGFMLSEGLLVQKNTAAGREHLKKASLWNDIPSLFMLAHYDEKSRHPALCALRRLLEKRACRDAVSALESVYGELSSHCPEEVMLLEKALDQELLRRDTFFPVATRVLQSKVIDFRSKERVLFSGGTDAVYAVAELPLKLGAYGALECDISAFKALPIDRHEQAERIVTGLKNADLRARTSYRPMCITADSELVLDMFGATCAKGLTGVNTSHIDVGELTERDFEARPGNVFLRGCDEDRDNVCMLFFTGEVPERNAEAALSFVRSSGRRRFTLSSPCVTIDLGAILPVCFADKRNVGRLRKYCDVIDLGSVTKEEMKTLLGFVAEMKCHGYKVAKVIPDGEAEAMLTAMSADEMERMLDRIVSSKRVIGGTLHITAADIEKERIEKTELFGFGGLMNENHRKAV